MKLRDIKRGSRATRLESFPLLDGTEVEVELKLLDGGEQDEAKEYAVAEALRTKTEPAEGHLVFDEARARFTVYLATYERAETPIEQRSRFFSDVNEVRRELDGDRIALLFEAQEALQMSCAARKNHMQSDTEFMQSVIECATKEVGEELPFERWQRGLRRSWVHTLANRLLASLSANSISSSDFEERAVGTSTN